MTDLRSTETNQDTGQAGFEQRLDQALAGLPREQADVGFTTRVMAHLEPVPSRRGQPWLMVLASAALLLLVVAIGHQHYREFRTHEAAERVASLRAEQEAIEHELSQLRQITEAARPVLYLGTEQVGAEQEVDLVFDLRQLRQGERLVFPEQLKRGLRAATSPAAPRSGIQPATYQERATY